MQSSTDVNRFANYVSSSDLTADRRIVRRTATYVGRDSVVFYVPFRGVPDKQFFASRPEISLLASTDDCFGK